MNDQAERLRQIIQTMHDQKTTKTVKKTRVITITSGKGGVGKSSFTINLALALIAKKQRVLIIDADFGLANIDVMLGVIPQYDLSHTINHSKSILDIVTDGPMGLKFISGGSGIQALINFSQSQMEVFLQNFAQLEAIADIILIDTGAGLSDNVISLVLAANDIILLTTPEPTSITDAYALVKTVVRINHKAPINLVVNKAETKEEAIGVLNKFTAATETFLKVKLAKLGYVLYDHMVIKAVKTQSPFFINYPKCAAAKHIEFIAVKLLDQSTSPDYSDGIMKFFSRLINRRNNNTYWKGV